MTVIDFLGQQPSWNTGSKKKRAVSLRSCPHPGPGKEQTWSGVSTFSKRDWNSMLQDNQARIQTRPTASLLFQQWCEHWGHVLQWTPKCQSNQKSRLWTLGTAEPSNSGWLNTNNTMHGIRAKLFYCSLLRNRSEEESLPTLRSERHKVQGREKERSPL